MAKGLHITHWSSEDLARQAILDGIVPAISPRTVRRILDAVDLQPHRTRYWRTSRLDARFKERAEKVLWCYGNAARLAEHGINVYEIRPGVIATEMTGGVKEKYDRLIDEGAWPIRRWGEPSDVARAVAAIARGDLPYSTGEVINVDGGFHLRTL